MCNNVNRGEHGLCLKSPTSLYEAIIGLVCSELTVSLIWSDYLCPSIYAFLSPRCLSRLAVFPFIWLYGPGCLSKLSTHLLSYSFVSSCLSLCAFLPVTLLPLSIFYLTPPQLSTSLFVLSNSFVHAVSLLYLSFIYLLCPNLSHWFGAVWLSFFFFWRVSSSCLSLLSLSRFLSASSVPSCLSLWDLQRICLSTGSLFRAVCFSLNVMKSPLFLLNCLSLWTLYLTLYRSFAPGCLSLCSV